MKEHFIHGILQATFVVMIMGTSCQSKKEDSSAGEVKKKDLLFSGEEPFSEWAEYDGEDDQLFSMLFTLDDFSNVTYENINGEVAKEALLQNSALFKALAYEGSSIANYLTLADADTSFEDCIKEKANQMTFEAHGEEYLIKVDIDTTDCWANFGGESTSGLSFQSVILQRNVYRQCKGSDFTTLDGNSVQEILDNVGSIPTCDVLVSAAETSEMNLVFKMTVAGGLSETVTKTMRTASLGQNSRSCQRFRVDSMIKYENGCTTLETEDSLIKIGPFGNNESEPGNYFRLESDDLFKDSEDDTWFTSGSYLLTLNNWSGLVSYNQGDIEPNWSLNAGTDSISGENFLLAPINKKASKVVSQKMRQVLEIIKHVERSYVFGAYVP